MPSIAVRSLTVQTRGRTLLEDVTLDVPAAGTLAVIGPRGAGKTTLLRTLAGLQDHVSGDVVIGDRVANLADPRSRGLAFAPEDPPLHPRLDVFDNLAFAASLEPGASDVETAARAGAVADLLALGDLLALWPDDLDLAQRQRVTLGRELIRDRAGYLFDDVFSAQPERVRPHLRSLVVQWQRARHRTSIFTTESVADALALGDQIAVLHRGELFQAGDPRDVYEAPQDVLVASVVGSPPMNLVPAQVAGTQLLTALGPWTLSADRMRRLAGRERAVAGIRPEDVGLVGPGIAAPAGSIEFSARAGDVEWRGADQLVYLECRIPPELAAVVAGLENVYDFDLFQEFLVAQVPAHLAVTPGAQTRVAIAPARVHLFDADDGLDIGLSAGERPLG